MDFISSNSYLSLSDQKINASYIMAYLLQKGWSREAIAGMLGNMTVESTINPGICQSLDVGNLSGGVGLVQWTPATKYLHWADDNHLQRFHMDSQLKRILYEVDNNIQWINSLDPQGRSFYEFTISEDSPFSLAVAFLHAYERPASPNDEQRGNLGNYWYEELTGIVPSSPGWEEYYLYTKRYIRRRR